VQATVRLER